MIAPMIAPIFSLCQHLPPTVAIASSTALNISFHPSDAEARRKRATSGGEALDSNRVESTLGVSKAAESKPPESTPLESKALESETVELKPLESKPSESTRLPESRPLGLTSLESPPLEPMPDATMSAH